MGDRLDARFQVGNEAVEVCRRRFAHEPEPIVRPPAGTIAVSSQGRNDAGGRVTLVSGEVPVVQAKATTRLIVSQYLCLIAKPWLPIGSVNGPHITRGS